MVAFILRSRGFRFEGFRFGDSWGEIGSSGCESCGWDGGSSLGF